MERTPQQPAFSLLKNEAKMYLLFTGLYSQIMTIYFWAFY